MKRLTWILGMVLFTFGMVVSAPTSAAAGPGDACRDYDCNTMSDCPLSEFCTACLTTRGHCGPDIQQQ